MKYKLSDSDVRLMQNMVPDFLFKVVSFSAQRFCRQSHGEAHSRRECRFFGDGVHLAQGVAVLFKQLFLLIRQCSGKLRLVARQQMLQVFVVFVSVNQGILRMNFSVPQFVQNICYIVASFADYTIPSERQKVQITF